MDQEARAICSHWAAKVAGASLVKATRESGVQEPVARAERTSGGADLGRAVAGVDGDAGSGALGGDGGGEAQSTAADDGEVAVAVREGFLDGDGGGSPGEGPPGAAVAVVVDDEFSGDLFGIEARACSAKRAQANGDAEEAVFVGADGGEAGDGVVEGERRALLGGGEGGFAGGAGGERKGGGGGGGLLEEVAAVQSWLLIVWVWSWYRSGEE